MFYDKKYCLSLLEKYNKYEGVDPSPICFVQLFNYKLSVDIT